LIDVLLPRLLERDIDVLLQEELIFNPYVFDLLRKTLALPEDATALRCRLSVSDSLNGETDILLELTVGNRSSLVLIENKIDATFQPRQGARYEERVANYLTNNQDVDNAACVLIAPAAYVKSSHPEIAYFDGFIPYEEIADAIEREPTPRARHRAQLIRRAIDQTRVVSPVVPDSEVTTLWHRVAAISREEFPELRFQAGGDKGTNSSWIVFKSDLPPNVQIDWKVRAGRLELNFARRPIGADSISLDELQDSPGELSFVQWNKVWGVRMSLAPPTDPFTAVGDEYIRTVLSKCLAFRAFYHANRAVFRMSSY